MLWNNRIHGNGKNFHVKIHQVSTRNTSREIISADDVTLGHGAPEVSHFGDGWCQVIQYFTQVRNCCYYRCCCHCFVVTAVAVIAVAIDAVVVVVVLVIIVVNVVVDVVVLVVVVVVVVVVVHL